MDQVVDNEVDAVVVQEADRAVLDRMILWRVIAMGCMAIWPVTIPSSDSSHREVEFLSLPAVDSLNPAKKGQEIVDEVGKLDLVRWGSYTMKRDMNIP